MHKNYLSSIGLSCLLALGATLVFRPDAPAQSDTKEIEILFNGAYKFKEENVTIKEGQSIRWWSNAPGKHQLQARDPSKEADFKNTGDFIIPKKGAPKKGPDSATNKFEKASSTPINYECRHHPDTMKGTITVTK